MTVKYKKKLLGIQKPETSKQLHAALGAINYVTRYLYNHALYAYWLVRLQHECEKKKKLVWTEPANLAWKVLKYLIENAPLLRRPKNVGTFCLQVDGCPYGVGAVLYQKQRTNNTMKWVIIDMYSRIIPKNLRNSHCSVHESLALVWPTQHWVHHLIRAPFIISTDHKNLINIFQPSKDLNEITRKQIYRLSLALSDFDFTIEYVPGLENKIADQLSRFAMKMIDIVAISPDPMYNDNTKILTEEERIELYQKYASWTRMLKRLRHNKFPTVLNLNYYNNYSNFGLDRKQIMNRTKDWLNLRIGVEKNYLFHILAASKVNAPPLIKDLFEQSLDLSTINDNDAIDNKIYQSIVNIRGHLSRLKDIEKDCKRLRSSLQKITNAHLKDIHRIVRQFEIEQENLNLQTNAANKSNIQTSTDTNNRFVNQVHTRSYWKKLLENEHKYTFVQPHMANMQDRIFYRQQFLSNIHLYRPRIDFFDTATFRLYQESDNLCKFIVDNIHNPEIKEKDKLIQKKFLDLQQNDYQIYKKILNNKFRINKRGIIEAQIYSTFDFSSKWLIFVPVALIREILDYCHHNAYFQHFGLQQTLDNAEARFWWPGMRQDCEKWCNNCIICQFIKGAPTHTAPLLIRELPFPRSHIMADFLGPVYNQCYILVLIDYGSGYCMLDGTIGCGVEQVLNMVVDRWVPIMGWFDVFESDLGSAFRASLIRRIYNLLGVSQIWSEPRNHKGTGKVERVIRTIQQILNAYNVESGRLFTDTNKYSLTQRWETLNSILPFIQFSLNQKRSRFNAVLLSQFKQL